MIVKELIEKLKKFDENIPVVVDMRGCEVRDFELEDKGIFCGICGNGKFLIITYYENEEEEEEEEYKVVNRPHPYLIEI